MADTADPFLAGVPALSDFSATVDPEAYRPLPGDWVVGVADVVDSTGAIAAGRYKTVNACGAAVIAGMQNALGGRLFPYAFGGDGAGFAVSAEDADTARRVLAETAALARDEFDLELRVALVPLADIRAAGHDVRLAFFSASDDVGYAMFSGGGMNWAEMRLKDRTYLIEPGPTGSRPDLTGLSCRFEPLESRRGVILSLIVLPAPDADPVAFRWALASILGLIDASPDMAKPIPDGGPAVAWPTSGIEIEARLTSPAGSLLLWRRVLLRLRSLLSLAIIRSKRRIGGFDPETYMGQLARNSDYRKYGDGLRMTIDCAVALADAIEEHLASAEREGIVTYGTHRQGSALITCYTPSVQRGDHVHFVDGAAGGYAAAAAQIKHPIPR